MQVAWCSCLTIELAMLSASCQAVNQLTVVKHGTCITSYFQEAPVLFKTNDSNETSFLDVIESTLLRR
jgi:hypothetical protein